MSYYNIILQDLFANSEKVHEMQAPPYQEEMTNRNKLEITYNCLLRSIRLKQRISSLIFAYYLGQLIENRESSRRTCKQIMSDHFYIIAIRVYYVFEINPIQIYATKDITTSMFRKLKQEKFKKLTLKL